MRYLAVVLCLCAGHAWAEAPATSPLPMARPEVAVIEVPAPMTRVLRPRPRPEIRRRVVAAAPTPSGQLCGMAGLEGERIASITSRVNGCGVEDAVRVRRVNGVGLSQSLTVDCSVARALNTWVGDVLQPAFSGQVRQLQIAGSYTCRGRNNQSGAKISEHGKGRAVDVSGITFRDGNTITVLRDWNKGVRGRTMAAAYKGACGIFGTTLGPGSDGYHEDHMHFDTPESRRSPYCR